MMADMLYGTVTGGGDITDDHASEFYGAVGAAGGGSIPVAAGYGTAVGSIMVGAGMYNTGQPPRPRYPGLYIGNLTWWTTDRDLIDAISSIGVNDVQEVKFFENRNNGQSKGYCMVTFTSDASLPIVMDKLPTKDLHGQNPIVTAYNRQNLNLFENQNKMIRPAPMNSTNGPTSQTAGIMGINSISGVHPAAVVNPQLASAVASIPYAGVATAGAGPVGLGYNQAALGLNSLGAGVPGGAGVPRQPYHSNLRMQMRGPRPMMQRGSLNNGPMMSGGHQMGRMRFMQQQNWNNSGSGIGGGAGAGGYNPAASRVGPQMGLDISNRLGGLGGGSSKDDLVGGSELQGGGASSSSYYNSHHSNSHQSDHYSSRSDIRDLRDQHHHHSRDLRDDRIERRLIDDRPSRLDDRSSRHLDDRLSSRDDRVSSRLADDRSERSSRRATDERTSRRLDDDRNNTRRGGVLAGSDDRRDRDRDRDDRSSRREEKSSATSSSRHHRERSHRSNDRARSRSRSKDRSREAKGERRSDRDRESRRERY